MMGLRRLPIRIRLTLAFSVAMAVLLTGVAVFIYLDVSAALLDGIDSGLNARAATIDGVLHTQLPDLVPPDSSLVEASEAFVQVSRTDGSLMRSSLPGQVNAVLPAHTLGNLSGPTFFEQRVAGIDDVSRILAVPVGNSGDRLVILVGSSMRDRTDALVQLRTTMALGGPIAVAIASLVGWALSGLAFRPIERMRRQAAEISMSGLDRQLTVPEPQDELGRLAGTLNEMLNRLRLSFEREHRFLDNASHELRTPLAILKAELELAISRPRSANELRAAVVSASVEADRLLHLTNGLLVLSRASQGRLPVHRTDTSMKELTDAVSNRFQARADAAGAHIEVGVPNGKVWVDGLRLQQALDNLVDNALRYAPSGSVVSLHAEIADEFIHITVEDQGPGLPEGFEEAAFEPFARADGQHTTQASTQWDGAGLGLAIVRAVAEGHGGKVTAHNRPEGGACFALTLSLSEALASNSA